MIAIGRSGLEDGGMAAVGFELVLVDLRGHKLPLTVNTQGSVLVAHAEIPTLQQRTSSAEQLNTCRSCFS